MDVKTLQLPTGLGPWSYRVFYREAEALAFCDRLQPGDPPPVQLPEDHLAPDGTVLPAGRWIVLYRPIILD
jgi:hypothetical protein